MSKREIGPQTARENARLGRVCPAQAHIPGVAALPRARIAMVKPSGLLEIYILAPRLDHTRYRIPAMLEHLPAEVREGLDRARKRASARNRRLALHLGDAVFPILRLWDTGFALDAARVGQLRGFVEIHEGPRLILTGLIQAAELQDGELICTFKRVTPASDRAAQDYEVATERPAGLLPRQ
jgi:hypothetical protein